MQDSECVAFLQWALPRLGLRWPGFRKVRRQVCRRLARRLETLGIADLERYRAELERSPSEWDVLDRLCRITISRFFRDRGVWEALAEIALPRLVERDGSGGARTIRAWSAGCASGEEPYSLSILWRREIANRCPKLDLRILASDRDPTLLARARRGVYPAASLREATALGYGDAFVPTGDDEMRIRDEFRQAVDLVALDLGREPPVTRFDLVFCRNLAFTYYDPRRQIATLSTLRSRLLPGGFLIIGSRERLPAPPASLDKDETLLARHGIIALEGANRPRISD